MVDDAVDQYLQTKRITETDVVKNGKNDLTQSPLCMLESSILDYRISQNNTYLYSCLAPNAPQMEVEFVRLKNWINELKNVRCRHELSQILFPIFCHMYLDSFSLTNGSQLPPAMSFFKRHQAYFTCESLQDIIKDIGNIQKKSDISSKPLVRAFRSAKCELRLSPSSAALLRNYIAKCDEPTILLSVLNSWFVVEDIDHNLREEDDPCVCPESEIKLGRRVECNHHIVKDIILKNGENIDQLKLKDDLAAWTETFKNLRDATPRPSPLLLLQLNGSENASCSSVCYRSKLMAVGSLSSDIKLFSFSSECTATLPPAKTLPVKINVPNFNSSPNIDIGCNAQRYSILRGHCGSISAVKLLNNPNVIISTSHDATLRAWRGEDLSCAAVYRGHTSPIWGLDVSALNLYIATGSRDKTARLWTLDKTFPLRLYVGHYDGVTCVKFHPNGIYLATGSTDKTVRLFSVIDGKSARLFTGHTGPVHALSFSLDGQYLASAGDSKEVIIWNLAVGQIYATVDTESQFVCDLSWNLDSSILAITFLKKSIYLLHVKNNNNDLKNDIVGKYECSDHRFLSCQFVEKNNIVAVGIVRQ